MLVNDMSPSYWPLVHTHGYSAGDMEQSPSLAVLILSLDYSKGTEKHYLNSQLSHATFPVSGGGWGSFWF